MEWDIPMDRLFSTSMCIGYGKLKYRQYKLKPIFIIYSKSEATKPQQKDD